MEDLTQSTVNMVLMAAILTFMFYILKAKKSS